jgi:hypothetical protein
VYALKRQGRTLYGFGGWFASRTWILLFIHSYGLGLWFWMLWFFPFFLGVRLGLWMVLVWYTVHE